VCVCVCVYVHFCVYVCVSVCLRVRVPCVYCVHLVIHERVMVHPHTSHVTHMNTSYHRCVRTMCCTHIMKQIVLCIGNEPIARSYSDLYSVVHWK